MTLRWLAEMAKRAEAEGERAQRYGHDERAAQYFQIQEAADDLAMKLLEREVSEINHVVA